jgi:hypothetical protein
MYRKRWGNNLGYDVRLGLRWKLCEVILRHRGALVLVLFLFFGIRTDIRTGI